MLDRFTTRQMNHGFRQEIWKTTLEKRKAADSVWQAGLDAEALALALDALVYADWYQSLAPDASQSDLAPTSLPPPSPRSTTTLRLLEEEKLRVGITSNELATFPRRQRRRLFRRLRAATSLLLRPAPPLLPHQRRENFILFGACLAVVVAGGGWWLSQRHPHVEATASATYSPQYPATAAVDGRFDKRHTEWILPNKKTGWLEIEQPKQKKLRKLRIRNAFHPPHNSYGAKAMRVEVFQGQKQLTSLSGSFDKHDEAHAWQEFKLNIEADRVRIHVESYYKQGGGLSEVQWLSE